MSTRYKTRFSDFTDHPQMYGKSYWGQDEVSTNQTTGQKNEPEELIVKNRNKFAAEHDLYKALNYDQRPNYLQDYITSLSNGACRELFDHVEAYLSRNGSIVIITSPYSPNPPQHEDFTPTDTLYCEYTPHSYVHVTTKQDVLSRNRRTRLANKRFRPW